MEGKKAISIPITTIRMRLPLGAGRMPALRAGETPATRRMATNHKLLLSGLLTLLPVLFED